MTITESGANHITVEDGKGRLIEQLVDHGDGTGTRTRYDADGNATVEQVTGLPVESVEDRNQRTIEDRLRQALDMNKAYLALDTPTAAQQRAQVARLTRQTTALIRHPLRDLTDTSDT